eukprot:349874-Chlamydomonas_euryale.AAC.6
MVGTRFGGVEHGLGRVGDVLPGPSKRRRALVIVRWAGRGRQAAMVGGRRVRSRSGRRRALARHLWR